VIIRIISGGTSLRKLHPSNLHIMAPSLEEPIQVNLSAPLMAAPKLVAPEPGTH
jgi:hypothetical protein